jgi:predicted RNase H-like HicB family nuclease
MKRYHVLVEQDDNWFIGRVLERDGVTTQGRSLDELHFMVRDAIALMWNEKNVELELIVPAKASTAFERRQLSKFAKRKHAGKKPNFRRTSKFGATVA